MISTSTLKKALDYGRKQEFVLFPEIKDIHSWKRLQEHPYYSEMIETVHRTAREIRRDTPEAITFELFKEFRVNGSRERYDPVFRKRLSQMAVLTLEILITGTSEYVELLQERMWEFCGLYTWELAAHVPLTVDRIKDGSPDPYEFVGLLAATSAFQLAEMIHLIGDKLDPLLVYRVRNEIFKRVLNPFRKNLFWWEGTGSNWASVCSGFVGCAAIYMIEDENELCLLLQKVMGCMESYIQDFDSSGVTTEGLGYWNYGFCAFTYFSELLRERTAGMLSLLETDDKIRRIAMFPPHIILSSGKVVNFADCAETGGIARSLAARVKQRLGVEGLEKGVVADKDAGGFINRMWVYLSRDIFWSLENVQEDKSGVREGMVYFPETQWLIDKRVKNAKLLAFAAKGGHNDEHHNHNDLGHFILHYGGINILPDLGLPVYDKAYFSEKRYENLSASSLGHSVPVINGQVQMPGRDHYAEVLDCKDTEEKVSFILDLTKAYAVNEMVGFTREFSWKYEEMQLSIKDTFSFKEECNFIEEVVISKFKPELVQKGKIRITIGTDQVELIYNPALRCEINRIIYTRRFEESSEAYRISIMDDTQGSFLEEEMIIRVRPL